MSKKSIIARYFQDFERKDLDNKSIQTPVNIESNNKINTVSNTGSSTKVESKILCQNYDDIYEIPNPDKLDPNVEIRLEPIDSCLINIEDSDDIYEISNTDSNISNIQVALENKTVWKKFCSLGTEMMITSVGR